MNNTANGLLAIGASPVMAHAPEEVAEMTSISSALVLNIGTLEESWVKAMLIAGRTALSNGIPVIFDPVGAGATSYRNEISRKIIEECHPSIIRGNASEIMALYNTNTKTKGVDSTSSSGSALETAKLLAKETKSIVVISGETDYITDGRKVGKIKNGSPLMARVTGMGCTATAIVAAFAAVNKDFFHAAMHGMAVMGIAGERAAGKARGNGSMQVYFLDELYNLTGEMIKKQIQLTEE